MTEKKEAMQRILKNIKLAAFWGKTGKIHGSVSTIITRELTKDMKDAGKSKTAGKIEKLAGQSIKLLTKMPKEKVGVSKNVKLSEDEERKKRNTAKMIKMISEGIEEQAESFEKDLEEQN